MEVKDRPDEICEMLPKAGPLLIVLSGPSGVGKDAVIAGLRDKGLPIHYVVTATTRPKRSNEIDGVDYVFLSPPEFVRLRESGGLLEWAVVHGNLYGTPAAQVGTALENGQDALLKIDVQGAAQVKKRVPNALFIFLAPPSFEELFERLTSRGTETEADKQRRLANAHEEMRHLPDYDYVVINKQGQLDVAVDQIRSILVAEKARVHPRKVDL